MPSYFMVEEIEVWRLKGLPQVKQLDTGREAQNSAQNWLLHNPFPMLFILPNLESISISFKINIYQAVAFNLEVSKMSSLHVYLCLQIQYKHRHNS